MRIYRFFTHKHVGDHVILTGAVRNVCAVHTDVKFAIPPGREDIFANNPDFVDPDGQPVVELTDRLDYGTVDAERCGGNGNEVEGFTRCLCRLMGIDLVPFTVNRPVLCLTDNEMEQAKRWNGKWLINANCQTCTMSKGYPHWQTVAYQLRNMGFDLVQVGGNEARDLSPNLQGITDMRGKTTIRQLIVMAAGCAGSMSAPTSLTNIVAAFGKPQVCLVAGREPEALLKYPGVVHVSHRCRCGWGGVTGCVHLNIGMNKNRTCNYLVAGPDKRPWCLCQYETPPEDVVAAVLRAAGTGEGA